MSRLRAQDGFTLPEVLIAAVIGLIVLSATLGLLESTLRLGTGISAKTDAMQRGRLALDTITQQLRSQVCLNRDTPAVVEGDESSVTFYADFSDGDGDVAPVKRTLELDTASNAIRVDIFRTSASPAIAASYPSSPTNSSIILENAVERTGHPFLTYWAYQRVDGEISPVYEELSAPLSSAEAARVARVDVNFASRPTGVRDADQHAVNITDQVLVRHADPNLKVPDPACT
jgi:prepilin-type N-terminal cleavage/methylation domain-containing protein